MSATPEIAFQPIIWAELHFFNKLISGFEQDMKNWEQSPEFKNEQFCRTQFEKLPPIDIEYEIECGLNYNPNCRRKILFYYLDRNYDYLQNIFPYKDFGELIDCIEKSKEKWLIFVHSQNEGEKILSLLKKRSIPSVFISRKSVETEPAAQREYDFIIEHEALDSRVVIATSILDNGINIKNEAVSELQNKTLNVVINSFDRIQFIQMLGRIRVNPNDNVSLFIRKYSVGDLKNQLRRNTELLLTILRNDMLSVSGKQELFDKNHFRYSEYPEIFSEYNPCAIYQLIDNVIFLLNTIRLNEPNFFIEFTNDDIRALKTRIYQYYRVGEGRNKPWSRYIFDILETPSGWSKRRENETNPTARYFAMLNLLGINYKDILKSHESSLDDTIENYFSQELELNLPNDLSDPFSVQLQWIGKDLSDVSPITSFKTCSSYNSEYTETFSEEPLKKYCVSESDINQNRVGTKKEHIKKSFLEQHGILKGSPLEKYFSDKFFDSKPLSKILREGNTIPITPDDTDNEYILRSFNDNSNNHKTYYIFVCSD